MDVCKMCVHHLKDEDGDIYYNQANCNEYLEFIALPIYKAAPDMYEALQMIDQKCSHCPICREPKALGHDKHCPVGQALSKAEGKEV